jgi:YgiT-type zinc finger domain-containing protein
MGVQTMDKKSKTAVPSVGRCVSCEQPMVQNVVSLDKPYKGQILKLHNFRVRQCLNCGQETYGAGSLIRFGEAAIKQFEEKGDPNYYCQYNIH